MNYNTINTKSNLLKYLKNRGEVTPRDLSIYLGLGERAIFKQLKRLLEEDIVEKIWKPPKVFYRLKIAIIQDFEEEPSKSEIEFIDRNYYNVTPKGEILEGFAGFTDWCKSQKLKLKKTALEYISRIYQDLQKIFLL